MGRLRLPNQTVELLRYMPPPTSRISSGDIQAFFVMKSTAIDLTRMFFLSSHTSQKLVACEKTGSHLGRANRTQNGDLQTGAIHRLQPIRHSVYLSRRGTFIYHVSTIVPSGCYVCHVCSLSTMRQSKLSGATSGGHLAIAWPV